MAPFSLRIREGMALHQYLISLQSNAFCGVPSRLDFMLRLRGNLSFVNLRLTFCSRTTKHLQPLLFFRRVLIVYRQSCNRSTA